MSAAASAFTIGATALIPLTSLTSLAIYLVTHPASPAFRLFKRSVRLPTASGEGLDGVVIDAVSDDPELEREAAEIEDPIVCLNGIPVNPAGFWRKQLHLKIALLISMVPAVAVNIALLVFTILASGGLEDHERTRAILLPTLLVPAHAVTILLAVQFLWQSEIRTHWPTTIHLASDLFTQFIILTFLAILPSTPFPEAPVRMALLELWGWEALVLAAPPATIVRILTAILPALQLVPLVIICLVRRGPPMYLPPAEIYPAKIVDAVPVGHPSLNPNLPNVTGEVDVTVVEFMFFTYATEVVQRSNANETMDVWDLPILPARMRALHNYLEVRRVYGRRRTGLGKMEGYNLLLKLAKVNSGLLWAQSILAAINAVGYYVPHLLLNWFLLYLQNDPGRDDIRWGVVLAFGLFLSNAIMYILTGIGWGISSTWLQSRLKAQLNTMLFSKTLRKKDIASTGDDAGLVGGVKDEAAKKKKKKDDGKEEEEDEEGVTSKSQIMTLFTVDVDRVCEFVFHLFTVVDAPIEIVVATAFLLKLLGTSALYGLLATIVCMPLSHIASKIVVTAQENLMKTRDQRTALMNEVLQGVRMLKFMAWERSFEKRINTIRRNELSWQARNYQVEVAFNCLWELTPVLVTVVSFLHYTLVRGERLTPAVAFTSIVVFAELRFALNALPETFIQALQGFVSCRRIEKYMSLAEVSDVEPFDGTDIVLSSATFTWPKDQSSPAKSTAPTPRAAFSLADLNLRFPQGKLSLICGRLGSGKSLLLDGLLGEADLVVGHVSAPRSRPDAMSRVETRVADDDWIVSDMVAYVPQQAWLQNASIKDNIIFSSPWNPARYHAVLEACSLTSDLDIFEDGDQTEIGEKGLNLSGGQKARVSLARAIYSRAGVLYLDDVLSAVDAHTAHAIMTNCFQGPLTKNRTVLLVSHHTALVSPAAAYIVALENGDVKFAGTRAQFVEGGLMKELDAEDPEARPTEGEAHEEKTTEQMMAAKPIHKSVASISGMVASEPGSETSSIAPTDEGTLTPAEAPKVKAPRKLIEDEKRLRGHIAWDVWTAYFSALGGPLWWLFFVVSLLIAAFMPVIERLWVERWTDSTLAVEDGAPESHSSTYYVVGYGIIAMSGAFLSNLEFAVTYFGALRASRILHSRMLQSVLFAPLRFHDTTSRGRILNRFGKDTEGLDSSMGDNFVRSIRYGLNVAVTISTMTYVGGWPFVIGGLLILPFYYSSGSVYGMASRDMRRLDSVTRSPLYSLFGETVSGVAVIRAFGASTVALGNMMRLVDTNMLAFAWSWTVNRWLSARFSILSSALHGVVAMAILLYPSVTAGMAGFVLTFASTIMHDLLFLGLVIRYAADLPDVLHGLTFSVQPCEKIGIVGSTGCGKSTLALSFFRFVEAHSGSIVIDGIDISKIGLTDLRSRIMIIPQDPTILSGTLRSTLDVFDEYDDADIYEALRRVHLLDDENAAEVPPAAPEAEAGTSSSSATTTAVAERNANVFRDLSHPVSEGGDNFSAGEKQLICMARAILRRNKVLFMDEATASIDYETDALINATIRTEFSDSTIITIAHRIHTIIDFDKVLVMHQGTIAEFASPAELLRDQSSRFYKLCRATGKTEFRNLKQMAVEAERKRQEGK